MASNTSWGPHITQVPTEQLNDQYKLLRGVEKQVIDKSGSLNKRLAQFLLTYRTTPHTTTGQSHQSFSSNESSGHALSLSALVVSNSE